MSSSSLPAVLDAQSGIVCAVGAGGKKTTLYRLAAIQQQAVVTSTVRIPIFDDAVATVHVTEQPTDRIRDIESWPIGFVPEQEREDRYRGYDPAVIDALVKQYDAGPILVKADGARMRHLKAPKETEPQLPTQTTTVLPIASAQAIGEPLTDEVVHRAARVAAVTGRNRGDPIRPVDVGQVLASPDGGCKDVPPDATVIGVINMVDTDADREVAREAGKQALTTGRLDRVVLTRMIDDDPIVNILEP